MASPKTIAMNNSIPKPTPILVCQGNPNKQKHFQKRLKEYCRGNTRGRKAKDISQDSSFTPIPIPANQIEIIADDSGEAK